MIEKSVQIGMKTVAVVFSEYEGFSTAAMFGAGTPGIAHHREHLPAAYWK